MTTPSSFASAHDAVRFIRAGHAIVTIASKKSGEHRTFRISRKEDQDGGPAPYFIGLLTGPDNQASYTYAGILADDNRIRLTKASKLTCDSVPVRAWNYVAAHLAQGALPADAELMHEGACGACGRPLTTPESIQRGIGPICWAKLGGE